MVQYIHPNQINEAMSCKVSIKTPEVGMCGTMYVGSDRYAVVVTEVMSPKRIKIAHMYDKHEELIFTDENGIEWLPESKMNSYKNINGHSFNSGRVYTMRKNGRWMPQGESLWGTCSVHIGHAENYRDPSF